MSTHNCTHCKSLVGRGANGGVAGEDVTFINISPHRHVKIQGIDNHEINSVHIATVGVLDHSQDGSIIIIMHQYIYHGDRNTINSSVQLEWYNNDTDYKPIKANGGKKWILTHEGYISPLYFPQGLPYLHISPYYSK